MQIFEGKDITSNLETNVNFFLCQKLYVKLFCYAGRNKIFSSAIFVRNNVSANGCYMYICFIQLFGQTDRNTVVVLIKYAYLNVFIIIIFFLLFNLS